MITAILILILNLISLGSNQDAPQSVVIPPMPSHAPTDADHIQAYSDGCMCEDCYWVECCAEGYLEFDAIFAAIKFKVAKNGRSMVKGIHSTSFKFAKKG